MHAGLEEYDDDDDGHEPEEVSTSKAQNPAEVESNVTNNNKWRSSAVVRRIERAKRKSETEIPEHVSENHTQDQGSDEPEPPRLPQRKKIAEGVWAVNDDTPVSLFDHPVSASAREFQARRLGTKPRETLNRPLSTRTPF